jgi:hypothetical protein
MHLQWKFAPKLAFSLDRPLNSKGAQENCPCRAWRNNETIPPISTSLGQTTIGLHPNASVKLDVSMTATNGLVTAWTCVQMFLSLLAPWFLLNGLSWCFLDKKTWN